MSLKVEHFYDNLTENLFYIIFINSNLSTVAVFENDIDNYFG